MNCIADHEEPAPAAYTFQGMSLCQHHFDSLQGKTGYALRDAIAVLKYGGAKGLSQEMSRRRSMVKKQAKDANQDR